MGGDIRSVRIEYDTEGSLATTHASHGSDMGLCGGLMGWDAADPRLVESIAFLKESGIDLTICSAPLFDSHPNTYRLTVVGDRHHHTIKAVSTGGGIIQITAIDDIPVSIAGDYYETLIFIEHSGRYGEQGLRDAPGVDHVLYHSIHTGTLIQIKGQGFIDEADLPLPAQGRHISSIKHLSPVLPVLSRQDMSVPFSTCTQMLSDENAASRPLWELAAQYESERAGVAQQEIIARMLDIVRIMRQAVEHGMSGTSHKDRILPEQSTLFEQRWRAGTLIDADLTNRIVLYANALMETKSAMGVIVAAPTAGSCAALPAAVLAVADTLGRTDEDAARAVLAGGLIGVFIANMSTFAAEVAGCQAECGSASGMTAAALATLAGGSSGQAVSAASMALQNTLGMICDPVANRVEVPCLGKNILAATNALACTNMALAGLDPVVPLDQVIETMDRVGRSLPRELRCTGLGGLSITQASHQIERRLSNHNNRDTKEP